MSPIGPCEVHGAFLLPNDTIRLYVGESTVVCVDKGHAYRAECGSFTYDDDSDGRPVLRYEKTV